MKKHLSGKLLLALLMVLISGFFINRVSAADNEVYVYVDEPFEVYVESGEPLDFVFAPEEDGIYFLGFTNITGYGGSDDFEFDVWFTELSSGSGMTSLNMHSRIMFGERLYAGNEYHFEISVYPEEAWGDFEMVIYKRPFDIVSISVPDVSLYYGTNCCYLFNQYTGEWFLDGFSPDSSQIEITTDDFSGTLSEVQEHYDYEFDYYYSNVPEYAVGEYQISVVIDEFRETMNWNILESPIESVSFDPFVVEESSLNCQQNDYTYFNEDNEPVTVTYYFYPKYMVPSITVVAEGVTYTGYPEVVSDQLKEVYGGRFETDIFPRTKELVVGVNNLEYSFGGVRCTGTVEVIKNPIESASFGRTTVYEPLDYNTFFEEYDEAGNPIGNPLYQYYIMPDTLSVVADGKVYEGNYHDVMNELSEDYGVYFDCFTLPRDSLLEIGENTVEWYFAGHTSQGIVVVKEDPIKSIEVSDITLYKEHSQLMTYQFEDGSVQSFTYYDIWPMNMTVNTTDGPITGDYHYVYETIFERYGMYLYIDPDVWFDEQEWHVGEVHTVYANCSNASATYNVTVTDQQYITKMEVDDLEVTDDDLVEYTYEGFDPDTGEPMFTTATIYVPDQNYNPNCQVQVTLETIEGTIEGSQTEIASWLQQRFHNAYVYVEGYQSQAEDGAWEPGNTYTCDCGITLTPYLVCQFNVTVAGEDQKPVPQVSLSEMSTNGISLSWNAVEGADYYEIIRICEEGDWESLGSVTRTTYQDKVGQTMGYYYCYLVRAHFSSDNTYSNYSTPLEVIYNPFTDVEYGTPAFEHVAWGYNAGIVGGSKPTLFGLDANCTRAQFCIMLYKMAGKPNVTYDKNNLPFSDIADQTANTKKAIIWCANMGIVGGSNGKFVPKGNITRAQLVIMLYKLAGTPSVAGLTCPFTDLAKQTSNTKKAIIWAYNYGIDPGTDATHFSPTAKGTREQLIGMLYGFNLLYPLSGN